MPIRNLKFAFRTLFKTPFVTTIAVLSLALGIGANAAIFSLFNETLLQPLPVSHPERLVNLAGQPPAPGSNSCNQAGDCNAVFSYPMFKDLERANTAFAGVAAHRVIGANIAYQKQTLNGEVMLVSGSYFSLLGLQPAAGRLLTPQDDKEIGGNFAVVLGYGYWQQQLGSDPKVVGSQIVVNGQNYTIVGVAPQSFNGTTLGSMPKLYAPITMASALGWGSAKQYEARRTYWIYLFARLKPGATIKGASQAVNAVYKPILSDVEAPLQIGMSAQTMVKFKARQITLEDGRRGQSAIHTEAKVPLLLLLATTGIVLLIACANIANLLLARGAGRSLEMAVRLSLGATRQQLLSQLLSESVLLALMGGVVSLVVARVTLGAFTQLLPPEATSSLQFTLNGPALLFAAILSLGTGLLFGVFPALHNTRNDLVTSIREGAGKHSGARSASRFRNGLVTAQIALSMALLVVAGLFVKSLSNVSRVDLGLKIENVVTFDITPSRNGYKPAGSRDLFDKVEQGLAAVPGVTGVTESLVPLLAGDNWGNGVAVQGFKKGPDTDNGSRFNEVGPGYFKTMGIPMISGRDFALSDGLGSQKVAVVNETFAKKFGLNRDAVGKFMGDRGGDTLNMLIIGLAKDAKYSQVKGKIPPVYFTAQRQDSTLGSTYFYVRTSADPVRLLHSVRSVMAHLDPNLPVEDLKTLPQQVRENVFLDRMIGTLSTAFAGLATLLAAIGLYGVLAYSIAQRTREIGVRMALGANSGNVQLMVLRQVGIMTLIGGLIGIAGAVGLGKGAQSLLYEIKGYDPLVMVASAIALVLVALGAGFIPALKASRVDPVQALRYE